MYIQGCFPKSGLLLGGRTCEGGDVQFLAKYIAYHASICNKANGCIFLWNALYKGVNPSLLLHFKEYQ